MNATRTKGGNMKVHASELYRVAYSKYIDLQGECPHWDYEFPDGIGHTCCNAMNAAKDKMKGIRKSLKV